MFIRFFIIALVLLFGTKGFSQIAVGTIDTTKTANLDTLSTPKGKKVITIESYAKRFDPRKALLYSAVFPGAGQAYNRRYWKLPLVYGGFVAGIYVMNFYQGQYSLYKNELFILLNDPTLTKSPKGYKEDQLRSAINSNRRQRDFFTAITGLWYILQMVEAHVDAHLKEFDLNPQLQVRLEPSVNRDPFNGRSTGLSLKLRF